MVHPGWPCRLLLEGLPGDGDVYSILHHPINPFVVHNGSAPMALLVPVDDATPPQLCYTEVGVAGHLDCTCVSNAIKWE